MPDTSVGTRLRHWLQAPRYLLLLFLATTLGFLVGLAWLGWNAVEQAREDAAAAEEEAFARTTEDIALEVRRAVSEVEAQVDRFSSIPDEQLDESVAVWARDLTDDALVVVFGPGRVRAFPEGRLLYYPVSPASPGAYFSDAGLGRASALALTDPAAAIESFRLIAADPGDQDLRAEALLGVATAQRRLGQNAAALATYAEVNNPRALAAGRLAEPYARLARCQLLARLGRPTALREELERFSSDLHGGRWQLTRELFLDWEAEIAALAADVPGVDLLEPTAAHKKH